ncbi:hypothetical protein Cgig2_010092 [Carnegiea gigantea]|uniref:Protein FAR1-RELATED SEQUENCE n=1 Tax=Carnegiea gigantea TaxID=171969 RepID=A0A9Q1K6I3_9CARY|nr:hypothetical protein Cgig2_010092 [Carnegiea gigantea]
MEGKSHTQCFFDLNELPDNQELVEFVELNMMNSTEDFENFDLIQNLDLQNLQNSDEILHPMDKLEPFVGQSFSIQEETFVFYGNYARQQGLSIRKDRFVTVKGEIKRRDFYCRHSGKPSTKIIDPSTKQRNRRSSRCGCHAYMCSTLQRCNEIFSEEWHVTKLVSEHSHNLLSPQKVLFLPANREINEEDGKRNLLLSQVGLSIRLIIRVLELEKNIDHGELPLFDRDVRNVLAKVKRNVEGDDAMNILDYFKQCKQENPHFQYVFTVDLAVQEIRQTQLHNNMVAKSTITPLRSGSPLAKQASQLQEQIVRSSEYSILYMNGNDFVLRHYGATSTTRSHKVFLDGRIAMYTCEPFGCMGMLCRQFFCVFLQYDCHRISFTYFPLRWCLEDGSSHLLTSGEQVIVGQDATLMGNDLDNEDNIFCPKSTTKGRPRKTRTKGGKESSSHTKTCSICGRTRHNASTCPEIKENVIPNTTYKKRKIVASDLGLNPKYSLKY